MYPDFKELLSLFNKHKVKYLVVGAYAVGYHAQPRATQDLDVLIQPAPKNGDAIFRALSEFAAPNIHDLSPADFTQKGSFYRMGMPPIAIDILPVIKGVAFNVAWKNRVPVTIDVATGLVVNFISRDDLIAAKLAAGRPKDLGDVDAIRAAAELAAPMPPQQKARSQKKRRRTTPEPKA